MTIIYDMKQGTWGKRTEAGGYAVINVMGAITSIVDFTEWQQLE